MPLYNAISTNNIVLYYGLRDVISKNLLYLILIKVI